MVILSDSKQKTIVIKVSLAQSSGFNRAAYFLLGKKLTAIYSVERNTSEFTFEWMYGKLASGVYLIGMFTTSGFYSKRSL